MNKLLRQVLLTPGKTVSFSVLSQKGIFRKTIHGHSGINLVNHLVTNILPKVPLGVVQEKITANRTMVITKILFYQLQHIISFRSISIWFVLFMSE